MQAMTSEQASLAMYQNAIFYKPKDRYTQIQTLQVMSKMIR